MGLKVRELTCAEGHHLVDIWQASLASSILSPFSLSPLPIQLNRKPKTEKTVMPAEEASISTSHALFGQAHGFRRFDWSIALIDERHFI